MNRKFFVIVIVVVYVSNIIFKFLLNYIQFDFINHYLVKIFLKLVLAFFIYLFVKLYFKSIKSSFNIAFTFILLIIAFFSINYVSKQAEEYHIDMFFIKNALFFCSCVSVAIFEELYFRLFIFSYSKHLFFKDRNNKIILSTLFTSFLFAIAHMSNLFNDDYDFVSVLNQMFIAFGLGFLFQSIFIKYRSILLIIFLHGLINYLGSYKTRLIFANEMQVTDSQNGVELFEGFGLMLLFLTLIILPISYLLIRQKIKNDS